ncbi:MAG: ubiquitin-related modifier 1 [Olpidium bornovanus]|uniref:Ubiquitin-related modifier 1 n=1 Tax=Olpidium bornovanus TaxID=278681 RepID=A0A8H8DG63_9FUNG|nr:MAG: ubiquitin-related modifier 1 [Olpidium bornovanus]
MRDLVSHVKENLLREKEDMFVSGETVRPGILVVINGTDWELEDELEYELKDSDEIVFISTLHGG